MQYTTLGRTGLKVSRLCWEDLCDKLGHARADVALAWLLANPVVTAPIIGPRTMEQLTGALKALEIKLDDETMKARDAIWPGRGGEAPEAYAWRGSICAGSEYTL